MVNSPLDHRNSDGSENNQGQRTEDDAIRRLKAKPGHSLYALAIFVAMSIGALRDFDFLPSFPRKVHEFLGESPSADMISAALLIYSFSAIILVLARMMSGSGKFGGYSQVAYLGAFYFFYHFAGAMEGHFWAVFAAGITILGLDSYHVWAWSVDEIKKIEEARNIRGKSRM